MDPPNGDPPPANAQTAPPPAIPTKGSSFPGSKRIFTHSGKPGRPPKRPFNPAPKDGPSASKPVNPPPRMGSKTATTTLSTNPLSTYFPVFTTNQGLPSVTEIIFDYIKAQNPKLNVTLYQFQYVTCVSYWNRLMKLKTQLGYQKGTYYETYDLNQAAKSIILPAAAAQYISSFGSIELPTGSTVVPSIPDEPRNDTHYFFPQDFLNKMDPSPRPRNYWAIDSALIIEWNMNISKGGKVDFGLRTIDNSITEGHISMVVSSLDSQLGTDLITPVTPVKMAKIDAEVGAAFEFRSYRDYEEWPGENAELLFAQHCAPPCYKAAVVSELCSKHTRMAGDKRQLGH